jgi:hypothetical protein
MAVLRYGQPWPPCKFFCAQGSVIAARRNAYSVFTLHVGQRLALRSSVGATNLTKF